MADGNAVRVGHGDAYLAVGAGGGELGEVAAQSRIENTEPVPFAGTVRAAKQCGQRKRKV